MEKDKHSRGPPAATAARVFALLLVICLVECATGSCLSYGHSCWGAHGKRSGKPPAAAPDWYLTRMLRRMAANAEMKHGQRITNNEDLNAMFRVDQADDAPSADKSLNENDAAFDVPFSRIPDSKPMLDDNVLSKMKLWQIMRESSDDK